jgi:hypothetical protein
LINVDFFKYAFWNRINKFVIHVLIKTALSPKVKTMNWRAGTRLGAVGAAGGWVLARLY